MAVARELPVSAGRIDLVGVDVEGELTLCECKLAANPGVRREVVGQLLEYASSLRGTSFGDFADRFEARAGTPLVGAVSEIAGEGFDEEAFESQIAENLDAGRFRLVIVVDKTSEALRQTVVYLNDHLDAVVLALELAYLRDGEVEMLLPEVYGAESAERKKPARRQSVADADTVVVAARHAYQNYLATAAYVCQPLRSFREEIQYLGFYKDKAIQQEVPLIRHRRKNVTFSRDEATRLRGSGDGIDVEIGELMDRNLDAAQQTEGHPYQVFLLSSPGKVQETLAAHNWGRMHDRKHSHPLKGTLYCRCGKPLGITIAKGRFPYFFCLSRTCGEPYVPVETIEEHVEKLYERLRLSDDRYEELERELTEEAMRRDTHRERLASRLTKRREKLDREGDKLMVAYYAEAIPVELLKREQSRITEEAALIESEIATLERRMADAEELVRLALHLARDCPDAYRRSSQELRREWNRAVFERIVVHDRQIADVRYREPFAALFSGGSIQRLSRRPAGHLQNLANQLRRLRRLATAQPDPL